MVNQKNRVAVVTGTSSGIGEATANILLQRGWQLIGISRRRATIDHPFYTHMRLDLAKIDELGDRIDTELGQLITDPSLKVLALVNSAASPGLLGTVDRTDPVDMLKVYALNVVAPAYLMGWLKRQESTDALRLVVNISSGVTEGAYPGMSTYGGTKVALKMTGMVMAAEIDAQSPDANIFVHSYDPGPVDTPMQTTVRNTSAELLPIVEVFEQFAEQGMLSKPEAHARAIADFLEGEQTERFSEQRFSNAPQA